MLSRECASKAELTGRRAMSVTSETLPQAPETAAGRTGPYDAIIIGAGISGMYQLHRLRGLPERAGVRGRRRRRGHLVLESLPRGAVRFRELDLRLLLLRRDHARVGMERAF